MDFPRDDKGNLCTDDFYIPCSNGAMIYHFGGNTLIAYVPSLIRGRNLIKLCEENNIEILNILEGDSEVSFRFKAKDIDFIAKYLKAKVAGKDIKPFSLRNLPKSEYRIPLEDFQKYKFIISKVKKEDNLIISKITNDFLYEILQKKHRDIDIKSDIKKKCMARQIKEYIHSIDEWENYLKYLQLKINEKYGGNENEHL